MWRNTVSTLALFFVLPFLLSSTSFVTCIKTTEPNTTFNGRKLAQGSKTKTPPMFPPSCSRTGPFPYTASLRGPAGGHRCGAVLIRPNAVLTAASCVDPRNQLESIKEVFLGGFSVDDPIQKRTPVATLVHEKYTGDPRDGYDIALVKLNNDSCLKPVPFLGRQTAPGEVYILLGFGRTGPNEPFASTLQGANVTNFDIKQCNDIFGADPPLDHKTVCTRKQDCSFAALCEGDEGSPIVLRETTLKFEDTLIAIGSYTDGLCGLPGSFSVHTDIQLFENWIMRKLQSADFLNA